MFLILSFMPAGCNKTGGGESAGKSDNRRPEHSAARRGDKMLFIRGGAFLMGSANGMPYEAPVHRVTVKSFWMDETEVTVTESAKFAEATNYRTEVEKFGWTRGDRFKYINYYGL